MRIAVGADAYGRDLKDAVAAWLREQGHEVEELAGDRPYFEVADDAARRVASGQDERAVLVCGTGMGMSIIANKHARVYAAVCETAEAAAKARSINNANVLTLGQLFTPAEKAFPIVEAFLATEFTQGWDPSIQEWLRNASHDIERLEDRVFAPGAP